MEDETSFHFNNMPGIATHMALLCSQEKVPANGYGFSLPVLFSTTCAYLSMLFILELNCAARSAGELKDRYLT